MVTLRTWLLAVIACLVIVLGSLIVIGGSPVAHRLPWVATVTPLQSLQSRLESSVRTSGATSTVSAEQRPGDPLTLSFIIEVPSLDSYDTLDPYRAMSLGLQQFPEVNYIQLWVQERRPDGTFDQLSYLWQPSDNRVGVFSGTYDPTFRGDQGGMGVGYVDGMTAGELAKVASGRSAPKLSEFPDAAP